MRRSLPLLAALGLIACGSSQAQEAIATAPSAPPPVSRASAAPLWVGRQQAFSDEGAPLVGPCGAVGDVVDGVPQKPDKKAHGMVSAGVGTHGYREVGGAVCVPIGDHGAVSLAFDVGRIGH